MALDLTKVASQVEGMVARLKAGDQERREHLQYALATLHYQAGKLEQLRKKIESSKTTWLVAGLSDELDQPHKAPPLPSEFTVIATDGSHIDVDRHQTSRCYLINIGSIILHYGTEANATLSSFPRLYARNEDLVVTPTENKGREQPVEGNLLGIKRSVEECEQLVQLATKLPENSAVLALLDGSLILWGLEAYPEFVTETMLKKGFLVSLDQMRGSSQNKNLAIISYISFPRSTDVINALRVALCPYDPPDCDRYCSRGEKRDCDVLAGISDRELFGNLLSQGERSALFLSQSSVVQKYYGEHQVYFFYLRVDDEIARVETPRWVVEDKSRLNLAHSLVLDQCRKGQGYPVALSEAHEQAVITGADRENFWQLVESLLVDEHLPTRTSGKSRSKKTRWI